MASSLSTPAAARQQRIRRKPAQPKSSSRRSGPVLLRPGRLPGVNKRRPGPVRRSWRSYRVDLDQQELSVQIMQRGYACSWTPGPEQPAGGRVSSSRRWRLFRQKTFTGGNCLAWQLMGNSWRACPALARAGAASTAGTYEGGLLRGTSCCNSQAAGAGPKVFGDERGFFWREASWQSVPRGHRARCGRAGQSHSRSGKVLRDLHYQLQQPQGRLVRGCKV